MGQPRTHNASNNPAPTLVYEPSGILSCNITSSRKGLRRPRVESAAVDEGIQHWTIVSLTVSRQVHGYNRGVITSVRSHRLDRPWFRAPVHARRMQSIPRTRTNHATPCPREPQPFPLAIIDARYTIVILYHPPSRVAVRNPVWTPVRTFHDQGLTPSSRASLPVEMKTRRTKFPGPMPVSTGRRSPLARVGHSENATFICGSAEEAR
ncbi:hypothetical protein QBC39DRAFT_16687 [Podospora conica]|nr:hypothetical protein QBC39DRAFT_16687 [Schizothecium conicum]